MTGAQNLVLVRPYVRTNGSSVVGHVARRAAAIQTAHDDAASRSRLMGHLLAGSGVGPEARAIIEAGYEFSARAHQGQVRLDSESSPYIIHPIAAVDELLDAGITDTDTLVAAILHDVVEDCGVTLAEIREAFGSGVESIVADVTDPPVPREERRRLQVLRAGKLSPPSANVKVADKIANVRDMIYHPPAGMSRERRLAYVDFAEKVVDAASTANNDLRARFHSLARLAHQRI